MTTVVAESIQYAIKGGSRRVNLSMGQDISKMRWAPEETLYNNIDFTPRTPLKILKHRSFRAITSKGPHGAERNWFQRIFSRGAYWPLAITQQATRFTP
jgi:hypothetical protein